MSSTGSEGRNWLDRAGGICSAFCVFHCIVNALLPSIVALTGLSFLLGHELEEFLVATALVLMAWAAVSGFLVHRSYIILSLFLACGLGLLLAQALEGSDQKPVGVLLSIVCGLGLVLSHIMNLRARRTQAPPRCVTP